MPHNHCITILAKLPNYTKPPGGIGATDRSSQTQIFWSGGERRGGGKKRSLENYSFQLTERSDGFGDCSVITFNKAIEQLLIST